MLKLDDEEYIIVKQNDILAICRVNIVRSRLTYNIKEVYIMAKEIKYGTEARTALGSWC